MVKQQDILDLLLRVGMVVEVISLESLDAEVVEVELDSKVVMLHQRMQHLEEMDNHLLLLDHL